MRINNTNDWRKNRLNDMTVADENYPKVKRINSKVIIGFTGDPVPTLNAINELKNYNLELLTLENIKRIVIAYIKTQRINQLGVKIIFSGKGKSNRFVSYIIDSKDDFTENLCGKPTPLGVG